MKEYQKIDNIFEFDEKYRYIDGIRQPYLDLIDLEWIGTEKVDGTNIRIYWDGHRVTIAGRTERSDIPKHLLSYLSSLFLTEEMEYVFEQMFEDKEVYLFGEGYGPKIQTGGGLYSDTPKFILFDVCINDKYLKIKDAFDIAKRLGLDYVPIVFQGSLLEAIDYVKNHPMSQIGNGMHEMEGLVLRPFAELYDYKGRLIRCKCKYRDILKTKERFMEKKDD